MEDTGEWSGSTETCWIIRAAVGFVAETKKDVDTCEYAQEKYNTMGLIQGRYFYVAPGIWRQEPITDTDARNRFELYLFKVPTKGGFYVAGTPTEREDVLVWIQGTTATGPNSRCHWPFSAAAKKVRWSQDFKILNVKIIYVVTD